MSTNPFGSISKINSSLTKNLNNLADSFRKLASGQRITKASDDAAGLAIAESLKSTNATLKVANRNIGDANSAIDIADGALQEIGNITTRLNELATQASNGTLSDTQRGALQAEYSELTQEVQRIQSTTSFNGVQVLNSANISAQVGTDSGASSQISIQGVSISSAVANVASTSISTQAGAQAALSQIGNLTNSVSQERGRLGASSSRLEVAENSNESRAENVAAAESRIRDLDVAEESARITAGRIRSEVSTALAAQANLSSAKVFELLK